MKDLLNETKAEFFAWRSSTGSGKHISQALRFKAVALLSHHSPSKICQTLGLSTATLKRWSKTRNSVASVKEAPSFVSLPSESTMKAPRDKATAHRVVVRFPNGTILEIDSLLPDDITQLTGVLLREVV